MEVMLKMTSSMEVILNKVKHVHDMKKNLSYGYLMSKHGFEIIFEFDLLIYRNNGVSEKCFVKSALINMCAMKIVNKKTILCF